MLWIILIIFSFIIYTFLELFLHKKGWLNKSKLLWCSPWSFLWGSILLLLLATVVSGEYKPWGKILYIKEAFKHILFWVIGTLAYYSFTGQDLSGSAAARKLNSKEFYYFSFLNPIIEEILFRGIILMSLLNKFPISEYEEFFVIISSILFALFHINYEYNFKFKFNKHYIFRLFTLFIVGNAIGFLVLLTGSLWMSILMHILLNLNGTIYFNVRKLNKINSG